MIALVKYEAARAALQAAHDVDEVKDIRDKAQAMTAYARQAKDTKLVEWASEIKVRAERRAGSMLSEMGINGQRKKNLKTGPKLPEVTSGATLENIGVSKKQSVQWQRVAAIPEERFEKVVAETKESAGVVTTAAVLRSASRPAKSIEAPKPEKKPANPKLQAEHDALLVAHAELIERHDNLADTAHDLENKLTVFETTKLDDQQELIQTLQKRVVTLEAEVERLTRARTDCENKNNQLIRQVKMLQKKANAAA